MKKDFLKTDGAKIVTKDGKPLMLRGVNVGGWLMMEAYFLHSPNLPEKNFRKNFAAALGPKALDDFDRGFRGRFIRREDIRDIAGYGFNCIRVPFHHRLVEAKPGRYGGGGLSWLDKIVRWGEEFKIWIILDFHAAPGCQNHDWHSDSFGRAEFWQSKAFQRRAVGLWEFLADRYRDKEYVAGYDLLNEAVLSDTRLLNRLYKQMIRAIRNSDRNHMLFIEGRRWAMDLDCLERFDDNNYVLSIHNYEPPDFTFHLVPHLTYPPMVNGRPWGRQAIRKRLFPYTTIAKRHAAPVFVGEFGVNARQGFYGEDKWLEDTLRSYEEFGFHWAYWTYKAVKNSQHPDGIFSYVGNPPWVNRAGPRMGWDTFSAHWPKHKRAMMRSWQTDRFTVNGRILSLLRKYAKRKSC